MGQLHLGIDLGTTNSAAATFDGEQVSLVRNAQGGALTPSVVRIDARGNQSVGARARRALETDPENTRAEFKRLMGSSHRLPFRAAGVERSPEELSAAVLSAIRQDFSDAHGYLPAAAVISVPALFEVGQTAATSEAARLAGFERVEMIQEPVASAIAAGWRSDAGDPRPWLVYDLGGGTFDASLLETQEGLLRVVGHDGDNFLGGRDLDQAIVDWALGELATQGLRLDPADPRAAGTLRRLRFLAEEAKIELARAREAALTGAITLPGEAAPTEIDLLLDRPTLERLLDPLVERTLLVCRRLLAAHGLRSGDLGEIVLVGGPTVMPRLRERVGAGLGAALRVELDPMTLVAQGAALFAATAGLSARPAPAAVAPAAARGPAVWLQHPSVTSDPTPFVVGRLLDPASGVRAVRVRAEGWQSPEEPVGGDGSFALMVQLRERGSATFSLEGHRWGEWVALEPSTFSIVHGVTLQDPPLSRSIGVALADDRVHVFFERGSPLPMRRTWMFRTTRAVSPGGVGEAVRVPVVQGEQGVGRLCRLVGLLEIGARQVKSPLPAGSPVEISLTLDRGGRLRASASLPSGEEIAQVAQLVVPALDPSEIARQTEALAERLQKHAAVVHRVLDADGILAVGQAERLMEELRRALPLAQGGDPDAVERSRRALVELDTLLAGLEREGAWPVLVVEAESDHDLAVVWVGRHGTADERALLERVGERLRRAIAARSEAELGVARTALRRLADTAYLRCPGAWVEQFLYSATRTGEATDPEAAARLVAEGRNALLTRDEARIKEIVQSLWQLLPPRVRAPDQGHGSGLL